MLYFCHFPFLKFNFVKNFLNSEVYFSRSEVKKQESGWFTSPESITTEPEVTTVKRVTPKKKKKNKRVSTTKSVATTSRQMTTSNYDEEEEDELPASTTAITIRKEIK